MSSTISCEEKVDLLNSVSKYAETYLSNQKDIKKVNKFSSDTYLYQAHDHLHKLLNNIHACFTEPMCICKDLKQQGCDCDHDLSVQLTKTNFEMGSNCSCILNFQFNEPLNQESSKKIKQEYEELNIRLFELNEKTSEEKTLLYISREHNTVTFFNIKPYLVFDIQDEKFSTIYKDIAIRINYMNYQKHDESSKIVDKFSM